MGLGNGNLGNNISVELGNSINRRGKVISSLLFLSIMEMSKMGINMVKGYSCLIMEIGTKACTPMVSLRVKGPMLGAMDLFTKDSSKMDLDLDMESGNMDHKSTKEHT
jgi:hypothetical protein